MLFFSLLIIFKIDFKGYVRVDILVIPVNKDVRIRSTVVDVNSGVGVNQIYAVILKDANLQVYTYQKSFEDALNMSTIYQNIYNM